MIAPREPADAPITPAERAALEKIIRNGLRQIDAAAADNNVTRAEEEGNDETRLRGSNSGLRDPHGGQQEGRPARPGR